MKKIWLIGWKDVTLAFRDFTALILMLLAPFLLTLGMGLITGRLSGTDNGPSGIGVVVVNEDEGELGSIIEEIFTSGELSSLLETTTVGAPAAARKTVDDDQAAAAIIVPPGYTASIMDPVASTAGEDIARIELYANPTRPTSVGIVKTIVDAYTAQVNQKSIQTQVIIQQLIQSGWISPDQVETIGSIMTSVQTEEESVSSLSIITRTGEGDSAEFDILAYMAPGMAMMFLMYVVSRGGQSFLAERAQGTLSRLRVSPTSTTQILAGKVLGIFLTGAAQMFILIAACAILFHLQWGDPLAVILLVLASVTGAVGWGMFITAIAKTSGQVTSIGSALMLTFGILGGSFFEVSIMPHWFKLVRMITPNAWSIDGFTILARGGSILDITGVILPLLLMGLVLFVTAVYLMNRRDFAQA